MTKVCIVLYLCIGLSASTALYGFALIHRNHVQAGNALLFALWVTVSWGVLGMLELLNLILDELKKPGGAVEARSQASTSDHLAAGGPIEPDVCHTRAVSGASAAGSTTPAERPATDNTPR